VVKASLADWTEAYDTGIEGGVIMRTKSPPVGITLFVVVLDRKDGARQIVPISCSPQDDPVAGEGHVGHDRILTG